MDSYFQNKKPRSTIVKVLWVVFIIAALSNAAALMLSYLAPRLDPYQFWYIAFLGLGTQIMMGLNLLFLLILGLKLSRWGVVPLVAMILGLGYVGEYLQIQFVTKHNPQQTHRPKDEITILSYNVHSFSQYGAQRKSTLDKITKYISGLDPDIICIQEFQVRNEKDSLKITENLSAWKYQAISRVIQKENYAWGLAILSKYPLIKANSIKFDTRTNSAMYADVIIAQDTIRIFNCHLQSTQFNKFTKEKLQNEDPEYAARMIGTTLRENFRIRAFQADSIAGVISLSPHSTILTGDFNDTPISYVYNTIRGQMKDTFCERGNGYEYSYIPLWRLFRIDYILHSKSIQTLEYSSPLVEWSDHKPVIAKLKIK